MTPGIREVDMNFCLVVGILLVLGCGFMLFDAFSPGWDKKPIAANMVIGGFFLGMSLFGFGYIAMENEKFDSSCREIAENPKAWVAAQKMGSVVMASAVIDEKIAELARRFRETDNAERKLLAESAIRALSDERECLLRLRAPARCD